MYCIARIELDAAEQPNGSTDWYVGKETPAAGLSMTHWDHEPDNAAAFATKDEALAALPSLICTDALVGIIRRD